MCLPTSHNLESHYTIFDNKLTFAGWGLSQINSSSTKIQFKYKTIDHQECLSQYSTKNRTIYESQLCVEGNNCFGDLGGPLLLLGKDFKWHVVGIMSFQMTCDVEEEPMIFTRVSSYIDWIENTVRI